MDERSIVGAPLPDLRRRLAGGQVVRLDGGLATTLEAAGADLSSALWSAELLTDDPHAIVAAHRAFVAAGAELILTASYQLAAESLERAGRERRDERSLLVRSVELAREAVGQRGVLIGGSLGPWGALIGGGREYVGRYDVGTDDLVRVHGPRVEALVDAGVDVIAIETVPSATELAAVARVIAGCSVPVTVSVTTDATGTATPEGTPLLEAFAPLLSSEAVVALGVNCVPPGRVVSALRALHGVEQALLAAPNAGDRYVAGEGWVPDAPSPAAADAGSWVDAGARLVGGCCGTSPAALRGLFATLRPDHR